MSDILIIPDKSTTLNRASTITSDPSETDFNVCKWPSKCLPTETQPVTLQNLMSVNSTGSKILPSDDSVLKIDVFGTADDFFVDDRLTRFGTWAMLKMVILSVLFFFLLKDIYIVWAILGRPPEETAISDRQLNFNLKQPKDDKRSSSTKQPYLLLTGDNIFRKWGRTKNSRPPDVTAPALLFMIHHHFDDESGFGSRQGSATVLLDRQQKTRLMSSLLAYRRHNGL